MRIITGDECGVLKESIPELSRPKENVKEAKLPIDLGVSRIAGDVETMCRSRGIVDLSFCRSSELDTDDVSGNLSFCALRANGTLERWDGVAPFTSKPDRLCGGSYKKTHSIDNIFQMKDKKEAHVGRPIAMSSILRYQHCADIARSNIVACCSSVGVVSIFDTHQMEKGIRAQYSAYGKSGKDPVLTYTKGKFTNRDMATVMAMDFDAKRVVIGGRERAATMLDVETGEKIWKAKNLPPNPQTLLQQPIWSTAIQFLSQNDTTSIGGSTDLLAVGTGYKQLQIYDVRADATQRRPVLYTPEWDSNKENLLDHRVTSLCQIDSNTIVVGDSAGYVNTLDLRRIGNQRGRSIAANIGRFSGPAGSVRQIVKHERSHIIACVGLDRMLRTYDTKTRKQLDCIYLKQRLNCMLFCADDTWYNDEDIVGGVDESFSKDYTVEGNIDEEDEVVDYIDSSDEDSLDEGVEDKSDGSGSDESSDDDGDSCDDDDNMRTNKRRKR